MKKILFLFSSVIIMSNTIFAQNQNVGIGTLTPNVSAKLDITANNKGLLIPRDSLLSLTDKVTIPTPATSLLIYNTNASLGVGYYYNRGTSAAPSWTKLVSDAGFPGWSLTGNSGTNAAVNFVGTTDNIPLILRSNNGVIGNLSQTNIFLGDSAGIATNAKAGIQNVAIGSYAMNSNDTGSANVAIGAGALISSKTDMQEVAVGYLALANDDNYGNAGGNLNTAVGTNAAYSNADGIYNTAVGAYSMFRNISGTQNTSLGFFAECFDTSASALRVDNSTAIGYGAIASNSNEIILGNENVKTVGSFSAEFSTVSDRRYKKDIRADSAGLNFIMQLRPVNYHYNFQKMNNERMTQLTNTISKARKSGNLSAANKANLLLNNLSSKQNLQTIASNETTTYNGLIAQEVDSVANKIGYNFCGIVKPSTPNGRYALRYATFVVPLIEAVQQQQKIIESQNKKIDDLLKRVEALEKKGN